MFTSFTKVAHQNSTAYHVSECSSGRQGGIAGASAVGLRLTSHCLYCLLVEVHMRFCLQLSWGSCRQASQRMPRHCLQPQACSRDLLADISARSVNVLAPSLSYAASLLSNSICCSGSLAASALVSLRRVGWIQTRSTPQQTQSAAVLCCICICAASDALETLRCCHIVSHRPWMQLLC